MRARFSTALLALLVSSACGDTDELAARPETPLLVAAAASLSGVMPVLAEAFEAQSGVAVELVFASTGSLASQIEHGAPVDLFFSADEATVERLIASGALRAETRRTYAEGRLALVWPSRSSTPPASLEALTGEEYALIAIANPELAPYGAAARDALTSTGIEDDVRGRIVQGENVAQAYQFVRTGNADAGIVALSVVIEAGDSTGYLPIDPALHDPIRQAAALVSSSTHPQAQPFLDFVTGVEGGAILERFGFLAPGAE